MERVTRKRRLYLRRAAAERTDESRVMNALTPTGEGAAQQISALLRANVGVDVCVRCIRTALRLDADAAEAGMAVLASNTAYRHERWICARCRAVGDIIRAVR